MNTNLIGIITSLSVIIITLLILYFTGLYFTGLDDCVCPANYGPVCGSDGKTYDNECLAKCEGVTIIKSGVC